MQPICRAVIDVGTNSVKLLVAEVAEKEVRPVFETSRQTRLGHGFFQTRRLQLDAITATAQAVAAFAMEARARGAFSLRVIATSAAREASNAEELTSAIERVAGLRTEIVSGEQEAEWVFQGVATDQELARQRLLLLDVGGGSTELIIGHGKHQHFRASVPLGTVRLLEQCPHSDPPTTAELAACRSWVRDFFEKQIRAKIEPVLGEETKVAERKRLVNLVGTGGTATIIARMALHLADYDRARIEQVRIDLESLRAQAQRLWGLTLEARKRTIGLPPNRADVILSGLVIYQVVMEVFEFEELRVSTRGLRFGVVMENHATDRWEPQPKRDS
jgi:exopolyphosphatase/guanosine-5'-triphosphate,3'-diphosphate pyrophosphatase